MNNLKKSLSLAWDRSQDVAIVSADLAQSIKVAALDKCDYTCRKQQL